MDEHFDLVAWLARRRRMLDGQKAKAMAEHLTACEKCRRLDELAAHLEVIALQNYQKGERKVADRCPEVETLALYFSGLLPFLKKRRVEQHLAGCDSCRHVLAEMMRAESTTAVSGEESVEPALQSDSHSERVVGPAEGSKHESAAASSELTGIPAQAPGQSALWITLKARWRVDRLAQQLFGTGGDEAAGGAPRNPAGRIAVCGRFPAGRTGAAQRRFRGRRCRSCAVAAKEPVVEPKQPNCQTRSSPAFLLQWRFRHRPARVG
ncbi:zf-HC2 domain-containing protein [candidate division KSB1 bacterium]|nr:zf-HC2 domain-containing protein [candidate division KSB1 bacterium]